MGCAGAAMMPGWRPNLGCPMASTSPFTVTTWGGGWTRPGKAATLPGLRRAAAHHRLEKQGVLLRRLCRCGRGKATVRGLRETERRRWGLTYEEKRVILKKQSGWFRCPRCRKRIYKPLPDSFGENIPINCNDCKISWITDIKPEPMRPDSEA